MSGLGLKGRKAVVVGANGSGIALTKFLVRRGALVTLVDSRPEDRVKPALADILDLSKFQLDCGEYQAKSFEGAAFVIVTPGTPLDLKSLEQARTAGVQVLTELEFVSLYSEEPIIAVAGTNGKTTTAALLQSMLEADGKAVHSNASAPLADYLNKSKAADYIVAVSSSFQLEGISSFKPAMILFLNLTEDHLDRYPNFETYLAANREVFRNADANTISILNAGDAHALNAAQGLPGKTLFFGSQEIPQIFEGAWTTKNTMTVRLEKNETIEFTLANLRLRGSHNRENLMAATLAALKLGVKPASIQKVIDATRALSGRVEFVRRLNSVAFYNDACGANPAAVLRTLQAFSEPVILISGGRDKNADYTALCPHVRQRVKNLILVGEAKEKINRALGDFTETFLVGTLEEAILISYQKSRSGDVVLFSPGCDAGPGFEGHDERGDYFKKMVLQLAQPRRPNVI
jgi:UDP-N-acetylmuramoylalanine--D-glutamate ligase